MDKICLCLWTLKGLVNFQLQARYQEATGIVWIWFSKTKRSWYMYNFIYLLAYLFSLLFFCNFIHGYTIYSISSSFFSPSLPRSPNSSWTHGLLFFSRSLSCFNAIHMCLPLNLAVWNLKTYLEFYPWRKLKFPLSVVNFLLLFTQGYSLVRFSPFIFVSVVIVQVQFKKTILLRFYGSNRSVILERYYITGDTLLLWLL